MNEPQLLIVAGAEKAGTTSLYTYLAAHPEVLASIRKETDYFRNADATLAAYLTEFPAAAAPGQWLRMESSPGYLAEARSVAPRIAAFVPHARLVFVLRDPLDRLRSSFRFYKSRLQLPAAMTFDQFVGAGLGHLRGDTTGLAGPALKPWHLDALARGRYEQQLPQFQALMPAEQLLVLSYDDLCHDVRGVMQRVAGFARIDAGYYASYGFARENASFLSRNQTLQRLALIANNRLETMWRRNPQTKRILRDVYKRINGRAPDPDPLSASLAAQLRDWYAPTYAFLDTLRCGRGESPRAAVSH
jgi:hypothetical protein